MKKPKKNSRFRRACRKHLPNSSREPDVQGLAMWLDWLCYLGFARSLFLQTKLHLPCSFIPTSNRVVGTAILGINLCHRREEQISNFSLHFWHKSAVVTLNDRLREIGPPHIRSNYPAGVEIRKHTPQSGDGKSRCFLVLHLIKSALRRKILRKVNNVFHRTWKSARS